MAFPHLQHLYIQNCPNLTKGLPDGLFSLKTLVIDQCQQLRASLPSAPDIRELKLQNCHQVSFNELPPQVLKLTIGGYEDLASLPPILFPLSSGIADTLKSLHLERCGKLLFPMHQCYASLESLYIICSCDSLELFSRLHGHAIFGVVSVSDTCRTPERVRRAGFRCSAVSLFFFFPDSPTRLRHGADAASTRPTRQQ